MKIRRIVRQVSLPMWARLIVLSYLCCGLIQETKASLILGDPDAFLSVSFFGFDDLEAGKSIGFLTVDTKGDGFVGRNDPDNLVAFLKGASNLGRGDQVGDDLFLARFEAADVGGSIGFDSGGNIGLDYGLDLLSEGLELALLYFPSGTSVDGDAFHYYRSDSITDGGLNGTIGYKTPQPGATNRIVSLQSSFVVSGVSGGALQTDVFSATVPEPSQVLTGGILAWLLLLNQTSRSRSKQHRKRCE